MSSGRLFSTDIETFEKMVQKHFCLDCNKNISARKHFFQTKTHVLPREHANKENVFLIFFKDRHAFAQAACAFSALCLPLVSLHALSDRVFPTRFCIFADAFRTELPESAFHLPECVSPRRVPAMHFQGFLFRGWPFFGASGGSFVNLSARRRFGAFWGVGASKFRQPCKFQMLSHTTSIYVRLEGKGRGCRDNGLLEVLVSRDILCSALRVQRSRTACQKLRGGVSLRGRWTEVLWLGFGA